MKEKATTREEAIARLCDIVALLRKECPWDRVQTHESLKTCMIEEAYEVCDAIDRQDYDNLREELGDVMLQVIFHSALEEEKGTFDITDVINDECEKMIRRHPHIFAEENTKSVDKVLEKWENIKRSEHGSMSYTDELRHVPKGMPALMRSYKVQKKAANAGFDWDDISGAIDKLHEETGEFAQAYAEGNPEHIREELGDVLFSVVNIARFLKIDPEAALHETSEKFIRRFAEMEQMATDRNQNLKDMSLEEMDKIWEEVKRSE